MKKLVLLICLFAATAGKAQTKDETISWLIEKLSKCIVSTFSSDESKEFYYYSIQVNECEITIEIKMDRPGETRPGYWKRHYDKITLPLSARLEPIQTGGQAVFRVRAKVIRSVGYYVNYKDERTDWNKLDEYCGVRVNNMEENIFERINKALSHLASFCPQKKEAF